MTRSEYEKVVAAMRAFGKGTVEETDWFVRERPPYRYANLVLTCEPSEGAALAGAVASLVIGTKAYFNFFDHADHVSCTVACSRDLDGADDLQEPPPNGRRHVILGGGARRTNGEAQAGTPEYRAWQSMIRRCHDDRAKDYMRYGGRGIRVCDPWRASYLEFLAEIGRKPSRAHSVDRIDGKRGYEPGNVRWATSKEQARNRSSNRMLTVNGVTRTLAEWAEIAGIRRDTLAFRIRRGWRLEDAVRPGDFRSHAS